MGFIIYYKLKFLYHQLFVLKKKNYHKIALVTLIKWEYNNLIALLYMVTSYNCVLIIWSSAKINNLSMISAVSELYVLNNVGPRPLVRYQLRMAPVALQAEPQKLQDRKSASLPKPAHNPNNLTIIIRFANPCAIAKNFLFLYIAII